MTATSMSPAGHVPGAPRLVALAAKVVWRSPQSAAAHIAHVVVRVIEITAALSPMPRCDGQWLVMDQVRTGMTPRWPNAKASARGGTG